MTVLTAELIADRVLPTQPRVSPDGRWVVWVAGPATRRDEHPVSALWLAPTETAVDAPGASARRLTSGLVEDASPRWAPDSLTVYFLSDRAERGVAQVWRIAIDGGEAEAVTTGKAAITALELSPDGRRLAIAQPDDTSAEDDRRKRERDDAQVWGERWKFHRLRVLDLATGEIATANLGDRHVVGLAWSPAGRTIVVGLQPTPLLNDAWGGVELALVDSADLSAEPRSLGRRLVNPGSVEFASSGEQLFYVGPEAGRRPSSNAVWALDLATGEARCLTHGLPACAQAVVAESSRDRAVALVAQSVHSWLGVLHACQSPPPNLGGFSAWGFLEVDMLRESGVVIDALGGGSATGRYAVVRQGPGEPPEVWVGAVGGSWRQVSDHGRSFAGVDWGRQTVVTWTAPDGWTIDGLLVTPPSYESGKIPLICYVHGGPYGRFADGANVTWAQWLAKEGWAVLMPNPRGGAGHGHRFADTVSGEVGNADYRDIMAGVDAMIARGVADPDRLAIGGWSQGGFMTAWAIGQTDRFCCGVMGAGVSHWGMMVAESDMTDFELDLGGDAPWDGVGPHRADRQSPIAYAKQARTPLLILHGERDERVPVSQGRLMGLALRRLGVPVEEVIYPREPHGLRERQHVIDLHQRLIAWYRRWLNPT